MTSKEIFAELRKPFHPSDLEWRVQSAKDGPRGPWAQVLAYVTNRAIMDRLDQVLGPENWMSEFRLEGPETMICRLSINVDGNWIYKEDGAPVTDVEPIKGQISGAMKRAAVHLGMGRYLYDLKENFANVYDEGRYKGRTKQGTDFRWSPPALPDFAIPSGVPTLKEGLSLLGKSFTEGAIPKNVRVRVGNSWTNVLDLLEDGLSDEMKKDYLLILELVEKVQAAA